MTEILKYCALVSGRENFLSLLSMGRGYKDQLFHLGDQFIQIKSVLEFILGAISS